VVAQRQEQTAARNMLGLQQKFAAVPFFWSQHDDMPITYVGHAQGWDEIAVDGDIGAKDCLLRYRQRGRTLAVASIKRDVANLEAELAMERCGLRRQRRPFKGSHRPCRAGLAQRRHPRALGV
jgi:apoptosis-inducing factor 3